MSRGDCKLKNKNNPKRQYLIKLWAFLLLTHQTDRASLCCGLHEPLNSIYWGERELSRIQKYLTMGIYHINLKGKISCFSNVNCCLIVLSFVTKWAKYKLFVCNCSVVLWCSINICITHKGIIGYRRKWRKLDFCNRETRLEFQPHYSPVGRLNIPEPQSFQTETVTTSRTTVRIRNDVWRSF